MNNNVQSKRDLPDRAPVAVIGGGVAGVAAALYLAKNGVPAALFEKGRIGGEQSSRNWGWIRKQGRDPAELPLMIETERLWREIAQDVDEDIGYRVGGVTYLAQTEEELALREDWMAHATAFGLDSRMLSSAEASALMGLNTPQVQIKGALHTPSDAYAEPSLAVPAMARLATRHGAQIFEGVAVRGLHREGGRVCGVVTEHGLVRCDAVILAGGIWSRMLLENEGLSLPQLAIRSSAMRTSPVSHVSTSTFGATGASIRPRADGGCTVARAGAAQFDLVPAAFRHFSAFLPILQSRWRIMKVRAGASFFGPLGRHRWAMDETTPFEAVRVMDPEPDKHLLDKVLASAKGLYPQLAEARVVESWAGMIDVMPDEIPVIGHVADAPGLVLATGLSGHGFGLGPGVGKMAAQLATGANVLTDPSAFAKERFDRPQRPAVSQATS
ncbi:MAG: glycine/D-amino acid oxidase-like deaminating enzyme [Paracoccaceae bacterium]|jgi:glycine/D-amino acid oxidase-like deaminating enzyme